MPKRLLLSLAHPDDESFGWGGVIARYVSQGVTVDYICATNGDRGTVDDRYLDQYGSVAAVREAELDCASQVLGFRQVYKLGYCDSGMMGSADNSNPDCLWQADEEQVVAQIVKIIRETQPHVILTFDPFGAYGHPDHIFMHRATTRAFHAAGDPQQYPDAGPAYQPQKLYYSNLQRVILRMGIWVARLKRQDPRRLGVNKDLDLVEILNHVPPAHAIIDVRKWYDIWDKANACHASQGGGGTLIPKWLRRILGGQTFTRAYPEPVTGEPKERDLFAGVRE